MVGEACVNVQGESPKTHAALLTEASQLPDHQAEGSLGMAEVSTMDKIVARIEERSRFGSSEFLFALGTIFMLAELFVDSNLVRIAVGGTIWTGWNVMVGAFMLSRARRYAIHQ
jgi:hypothetical protein